ncbi:MAG: cation:proton antiporter [Clostridiaceae bacterium]|jgi:Kef-type K+ transport system membrane component KefB|nr:cation:proton antiporter [Clostridiaceae bacterium]
MNILLSLCLAMLAGLLMTRLVKIFGLPNVTGYIIAGLLIGPFCFKFIPTELLEGFSIITTVALGFIAFSIGGEFKIEHLKQLGKKVVVITVVQALMTVLVVDLLLFVASFFIPGLDAPIILTLGAIATATAPAATLMVVRQYKAKGIVTQTLLPVVAGDDAIGLIIFSISLSIAKALANNEALTFKTSVLIPLYEISMSLIIGAVLGFILSLSMKFFKSRANRISLIVAITFGGVALSQLLELSALLTCMMIGAMYANICKNNDPVMEAYDRWTPPVFLLFFVISGAELNVEMIISVGVIGILYLVSRSIGKYFGAFAGSKMVHAHPNVTKYLGLALLPQAGVAVGMAQIVMIQLPQYGDSIRTVILCATLVYELIGPVVTKIALTKAGEIEPKLKISKKGNK